CQESRRDSKQGHSEPALAPMFDRGCRQRAGFLQAGIQATLAKADQRLCTGLARCGVAGPDRSGWRAHRQSASPSCRPARRLVHLKIVTTHLAFSAHWMRGSQGTRMSDDARYRDEIRPSLVPRLPAPVRNPPARVVAMSDKFSEMANGGIFR